MRVMKFTGLHHITMITGDAQRNARYYGDLLGLQLGLGLVALQRAQLGVGEEVEQLARHVVVSRRLGNGDLPALALSRLPRALVAVEQPAVHHAEAHPPHGSLAQGAADHPCT